MLLSEIARFCKRTHEDHRSAVRMYMVVRGLGIIERNEDRGASIRLTVVVDWALHNVLDNHAQCDVAIFNLLSWFRVNRLTGFWINPEVRRGFARVIIWQINIEKAGKGPLICHAIEIMNELQSSSLI